jgi:hypothetical protein
MVELLESSDREDNQRSSKLNRQRLVVHRLAMTEQRILTKCVPNMATWGWTPKRCDCRFMQRLQDFELVPHSTSGVSTCSRPAGTINSLPAVLMEAVRSSILLRLFAGTMLQALVTKMNELVRKRFR